MQTGRNQHGYADVVDVAEKSRQLGPEYDVATGPRPGHETPAVPRATPDRTVPAPEPTARGVTDSILLQVAGAGGGHCGNKEEHTIPLAVPQGHALVPLVGGLPRRVPGS